MEKKSKKKKEDIKKKQTEETKENERGGFPQDVDFRKNLGCGG